MEVQINEQEMSKLPEKHNQNAENGENARTNEQRPRRIKE